MKPEISIIVPIYKVEPYIRKCINSILAQTFTSFELILVNDGSPDNCGKICDEYSQIDERIIVIHKENGGLSSARNAGLKIAQGKYIGFIDSDDYIDKDMYEIMYRSIKRNQSDMVLCNFYMVDETGKILNDKTDLAKNNEENSYTNLESLNKIYTTASDANFGTGINPKWIIMCNKLIHTDLFKNLAFSKGVKFDVYEDEGIAHRLLYNSSKTTYINRKLYYYLQRDGSLSNFTFSVKKFERVYALKNRAEFFKQKGLITLHYKALNDYMDDFFWNYFMAKSTLSNIKDDLKRLKKTMNDSFLSFMKSPLISWKQKVFIAMFIINPYVLELFKRNEFKSNKAKSI